MAVATESPTLVHVEQQVAFHQLSAPDADWMLVIERLIMAGCGTLRTTRFDITTPLDISATWDGGAVLIEAKPSRWFATFHQSLERLVARNRLAGTAGSAALGAARIVDSSIVTSIRPPHLEALDWIKEATGLTQDRMARLVSVSRQTLNRWERGEPIKDINRQRIFAVREVLERAVVYHPTRATLIAWLDTPRGAGGRTPADLLAAGDIGRARLLAVSSPSPRLSRPPSWVRRPVAPAFRAGAERPQEAVPLEPDDGADDEAPTIRD